MFFSEAEESGESVRLTAQEILDEVYESQNSPERCDTDLRKRQAKVLLLAGFETTCIHLAKDCMHIPTTPCVLISHHGFKQSAAVTLLFNFTVGTLELVRNPDIQTKFRDECLEFRPISHDDLTNKLPYLDAVLNKVLRLHAAVKEIAR